MDHYMYYIVFVWAWLVCPPPIARLKARVSFGTRAGANAVDRALGDAPSLAPSPSPTYKYKSIPAVSVTCRKASQLGRMFAGAVPQPPVGSMQY